MATMLPKRVTITDDTMREGLQIESPDIKLADKLRLLDALGDTGAKVISIGSFAHPKWTPAMANIEELAAAFVPKPGVKYTAAVFNQRGYDRADAFFPKVDVRTRGFATAVEISDSFARRNYNRSQAQQIAAMDPTIERARAADAESGTIVLGSPWGCNFEGPFTLAQQLEMIGLMVDKWHDGGFVVKKLSFSDAMGWNAPHTVRETIVAIRNTWPEIENFHMHLHNTRGSTIASYYEALQLGVDSFDTSIGGMGGCPYCGNGRSAGHVPTEDFVDMCHEMGIETGYHLHKLIEACWVAEDVIGHELYGHVSKGGPRPRGAAVYPIDMPFVETLDEASHFLNGPGTYENQISPWEAGSALINGTKSD
ncbi:MAG: citramalate synthase [Acidimicrobiales bacterium]|jgi:hydroxymethylglutaryl-CoA lyase